MNAPTGSLELIARRSGDRTVLERVRYEGISRCSRAFHDGGAARVVLSQLGPGVMRGDATLATGRLRAGAHVIVTSQTATRVFGGSRASAARANWTLEDGALLELIGEPLLAEPGARFATSVDVELVPGARVLLTQVTCVPPQAQVRVRTSVTRLGYGVYYDSLDAQAAPGATGSFALIGIGSPVIDAVVTALDAVADVRRDVNVGVGALADGVFVSLVAEDPWTASAVLRDLRYAARTVR